MKTIACALAKVTTEYTGALSMPHHHIDLTHIISSAISVSVTMSVVGHSSFEAVISSDEWRSSTSTFKEDEDVIFITRTYRAGLSDSRYEYAAFFVQKVDTGIDTVTISGLDVYAQLDRMYPFSDELGPGKWTYQKGRATFTIAKGDYMNNMMRWFVSKHANGYGWTRYWSSGSGREECVYEWANGSYSSWSSTTSGPRATEDYYHSYDIAPCYPKAWDMMTAKGYIVTQTYTYSDVNRRVTPQIYVAYGTTSTFPVTSGTSFTGSTSTVDSSTHADCVNIRYYSDKVTEDSAYYPSSAWDTHHLGCMVKEVPDDVSDIQSWVNAEGSDYLYEHRRLTSYEIKVPPTAFMGVPPISVDGGTVKDIYLGSTVQCNILGKTVSAQVVESTEVFKDGHSSCDLTVGTVRPSNVMLSRL